MHVAQAEIRSERASRYLVQLCKHFAHKTTANYDDRTGKVDFQPGLCVMHAAEDCLSLRCEASNEPDLIRVKSIVADHLVRFAWQESIAVEWRDELMPAAGTQERP